MPEINSPITPLSPTVQLPSKPKSSFLTIPLELRLQIYSYVLIGHPIHHAHLAPLDPPTTFEGMNSSDFLTARLATSPSHPQETEVRTLITHLSSPSPSAETADLHFLYPISHPRMVSGRCHQRIQGKIPTALLASCKQVYAESKMAPWEQNTFTFINWFWSGIYAARQFSRSLRPWQSDAMRFTGVEVLGRDLRVDGMRRLGGGIGVAGLGEWWELCRLWKGVWGLRLGVKGAVCEKRKVEVDGTVGWNGELGTVDEQLEPDNGILDVNAEWVQHGLLQMKELRWIEIEIEDEDVSRETKIAFCGQLEEAFNQLAVWREEDVKDVKEKETGKEREEEHDSKERNIKIILIERLKLAEDPVSNKDFTWYGGTAGDDSIYGLDM
jgi:hypothetical protein